MATTNKAVVELVQGAAAASLVIYQGDRELLRRMVSLARLGAVIDQLRGDGDGAVDRVDWDDAPRLLLSPVHVVLLSGRMTRMAVRFAEETRPITQVRISPTPADKTIPARWWIVTYQAQDVTNSQHIVDIRLLVELPEQSGSPSLTRRVGAWPFANVYDGSALICWGANPAPRLGSPIDIDAMFFGAPFNYDLMSGHVHDRAATIWRARSLTTALAPYHATSNTGVSVEDALVSNGNTRLSHAQIRLRQRE